MPTPGHATTRHVPWVGAHAAEADIARVSRGFPRGHGADGERTGGAGLDSIAAVARLETGAGDPLAVRIGIATGLVVVGALSGAGALRKPALVGETPNLAARLQALAEPGTIVVGASTRRLLGDLFRLRDLGMRELKGIAEPVAAWAVEGGAASERRFDAVPPAGLRRFHLLPRGGATRSA